MKVMRGDALTVPFEIFQGDTALKPGQVDDIEVCIGGRGLRRSLADGSIVYNTEREVWSFRLSQEDTFAMLASAYDVIARVKYKNHPDFDVRGVELGRLEMERTFSREIL